jgi:flagellar hook protein FlgE
MIGSLFAGISGLNANATVMTVIGDNIANVNTTAFKANRSSFANVLSQSLGGSTGNDIGRGVEFWGTSPLWNQGSLENTGSATDLAINGKGFFIVNDPSGASFYTRAGLFSLNELGEMVNPDSLTVQGYEIDASGNLGNLTDISIPGDRVSPPSATVDFSFDINLDAGAATGATYTTSQSVFDSLGNAIPLSLTFTKEAAARTWTVAATAPSTTAPITFTPTAGAAATTASFVFDTSGNLTSPSTDLALDMTMTNGAANLQINWDLVDAAGAVLGDITGYSSPSNTTFQTQDGFTSGVLRSISVDESGVVAVSYSNGELIPMFQVAMADFPAYEGLTKLGANLYAESTNSGQPLPGVAGDGRLGSITPMAIEMSNVDLAQEFVKMITTQRAFQANSRVITTSDEILNELINLKR